MTVDLDAYLDAVPHVVVERIRGARRVLAVGHENPDADTLGATLGVVRLVEALGGTADPVCTDPVPPLYDFLAGIERFRTDPDPTRRLRPAGRSPTAARSSAIGEVARPPRRAVRRGCRASSSTTTPRTTRPARPTGSTPPPPRRARWSRSWPAGSGVPLDADDGALAAGLMAGIVMDTATFAHPNATPRTLAVAAALVEAGAPLSDISRRLYRSKPDGQLRLFGRVLDRLESVDDGRIVWST